MNTFIRKTSPVSGLACWVVLIAASLSSPLEAATIYVDRLISSTSCTTYNPTTRSCGGGTDTAYRTVAGAAAVATGGTLVIIREGTYAEALRPGNSGTAGNYITFKNQGTEQVFLTGSPAVNIQDRSYIEIDGLRADHTQWLEARNSHFNVIRNCRFTFTPASGTTGNVRFISSNNNRILDNYIESGQDNLLLIDSNYNLVQGNTILEGRHTIFSIRCGDFNIIRGNHFSNTIQKIGEVYDCGTDTSAVPNAFDSTHHNVIEDNIFAGAVPEGSDTTSNGNGIQYGGQDGIIRRNVFTQATAGLGMQVYGDESLHNTNNRVYQNVFYNNKGAGIAIRPNAVGNQFKNNILFANAGCPGGACDTGVSAGQIVYRTPFNSSGSTFVNNDIIYQSAGQNVLEDEFASGHPLSQANSLYPGVFSGTLELNPQFVNAAGNDFTLQASSPMIDAGVFLTATSGAGSGTSMTVADARNFMDGFGIAGEQGDLIQLAGQTQTARVVAINYTTNVLTLSQSLTWTGGQGVSLAYNGGAPDIGANEFVDGPPAAPSNLVVSP